MRSLLSVILFATYTPSAFAQPTLLDFVTSDAFACGYCDVHAMRASKALEKPLSRLYDSELGKHLGFQVRNVEEVLVTMLVQPSDRDQRLLVGWIVRFAGRVSASKLLQHWRWDYETHDANGRPIYIADGRRGWVALHPVDENTLAFGDVTAVLAMINQREAEAPQFATEVARQLRSVPCAAIFDGDRLRPMLRQLFDQDRVIDEFAFLEDAVDELDMGAARIRFDSPLAFDLRLVGEPKKLNRFASWLLREITRWLVRFIERLEVTLSPSIGKDIRENTTHFIKALETAKLQESPRGVRLLIVHEDLARSLDGVLLAYVEARRLASTRARHATEMSTVALGMLDMASARARDSRPVSRIRAADLF